MPDRDELLALDAQTQLADDLVTHIHHPEIGLEFSESL